MKNGRIIIIIIIIIIRVMIITIIIIITDPCARWFHHNRELGIT